jgi:hypothetical protein
MTVYKTIKKCTEELQSVGYIHTYIFLCLSPIQGFLCSTVAANWDTLRQ